MKITRVRVYSPPNSQSALQSERHGGHGRDRRRHHRHRRRRLPRHAGAVRRPADRTGPAVHRAPLAGHVRAPSSIRRAARRWTRIGALDLALWDIKGKVLEAARPRGAGRHGAQLLRVLQHRRHDSRRQPGHERQGARAAHHRGRLSRLPHGRRRRARQHHLQHPRAAQSSCTRIARRRAKASARTATGASISTSASTSPTPSAAAI